MAVSDFKPVAEAALQMATILLPQWIGGKRQGAEWLGESRSNGGLGNSWAVNLETGKWLHGGGDERGLDLISLYAALNHVNQGVALEEVAKQCGVTDRPARVLERKKPPEKPVERIPEDAPNPKPHHQYGEPVAIHRYQDAFWICRYAKPEGGKFFTPFTWRDGKWWAKGYPEPRPLYNVGELRRSREAPVLIVEGEKCVDAAIPVMRAFIVMTWAHGAAAVKKNDWSVLKDRDVLIWPDADDAGRKAAAQVAEQLAGLATRVRILDTTGQPEGWDIADAIADGWESKQVAEWAKGRTRVVFPREVEATPQVEQSESALVNWHSLGLDCNEGGTPHPTVANASTIIQMHPAMRGKIWYDHFTGKVYTTLRSVAPRLWTDADDLDLTVFIQQSMRLPKFNLMMVQSSVMHAARQFARNSLTDWLDGLTWDSIPRLETWLADTLGVEHNEYSMAIAVNWPISMVARAYVPGCKVDTMPVLEGAQGLSKSTFLEVLGYPWYSSLPMAFGDKDFLQAIQGRWLIEIPDMTGFSKREHTHILATISIRNDVYRPSYARHTIEHPRVAVFAATSETDDYLQDARGRRRYWPLRCTAIDIDALRGQREQVFAEARERYKAGAKWYEMPAVADVEQSARTSSDLWTEKILSYCNDLWEHGSPQIGITSARILADVIELPLAKQSDTEKKRVARILRENGWTQVRDLFGRRWKRRT